MKRSLLCLSIAVCAAIGSAQFYKGAQGAGDVLGRNGASGKVSFGVLMQLRNTAATDVTRLFAGTFQFDSTSGTPTRITMSKPTRILVSLNSAEFGGPAQLVNPLSGAAYTIPGDLTVTVRDVTKPGSALTIMDEIKFTFTPHTNATPPPFVFDGWAKNGIVEVFGGYTANTLGAPGF